MAIRWHPSVTWYIGLCLCCQTLADQPQADITADHVTRHVHFLASEQLHGRGAGTTDERLAAEYIGRCLDTWQLAAPHPGTRYQEFTFASADGYAVRSMNVLAWIPGSDPRLNHEVVVVGAHFDHLGIDRGQIHPGADDNASGVAALLEMSASWATQRDQLGRSIAIVFFGAEEVGLIGSSYFVRNSPVPMPHVAAMVNLDMIGRPLMDQPSWEPWKRLARIDAKNSIAVIGASPGSLFAKTVDTAAGEQQLQVIGTQTIPFFSDIIQQLAKNRSDHAPFEEAGVPTLFFSSGSSADYHRGGDVREKVDSALLARRATMIRDVVITLSRAPRERFTTSRRPTHRR